jgi:hypothetical protein
MAVLVDEGVVSPAAMHADPLAVHGLQFRLDCEDEHFDVGQRVPTVTTVGVGNTAVRRRRQVGIAA